MRHKNLIRMLALGLSAALLLSGCGGEDAGKESSSPSPSETESESVPPEDAPKDYSDSWTTRLERTIQDGGDYAEDLFSMSDAIGSMIDGYNSII